MTDSAARRVSQLLKQENAAPGTRLRLAVSGGGCCMVGTPLQKAQGIEDTPDLAFDDWMQSNPGLWQKIIVPAEMKWEVRDKLDQSNVTERVLFPGLDGLSQWLKRHYTPR
mgnify:CR=1 FL=1